MQDIGLIEFGDSGLNLVIKLIGSERKTFGAYHIFVMRMQQTGLATFRLGAGKTVK